MGTTISSRLGYAGIFLLTGMMLIIALTRHKVYGAPLTQTTTFMLVISLVLYLSCGWFKLCQAIAGQDLKWFDEALKVQLGIALVLMLFPLFIPV